MEDDHLHVYKSAAYKFDQSHTLNPYFVPNRRQLTRDIRRFKKFESNSNHNSIKNGNESTESKQAEAMAVSSIQLIE